ncbi:MAG: large conductance mechanosensitive channel [Solirubrobacteraceae bacterium]|nr:large conductance mechanosensitive channel [Solirubrobacteraceae bacterium]
MSDLLKGFKEFIMKGNVVDLAVAVVIGAAFTLVINAFVSGIITPLISAILGKTSFDDLHFTIHHGVFAYGTVLTALINFVSVAAVLYFLVVTPMNRMSARRKAGGVEAESSIRACPECISDIPKEATRCAFCTAQITPVV